MRDRQASPSSWRLEQATGRAGKPRICGRIRNRAAESYIKVSSCARYNRRSAIGKPSAADGTVLDLTTGPVRDRMLEVDPVTLGNPEQVGGPPDHIVFEF